MKPHLTCLCISDSFGLPREGVEYRNTWIAKIKATLPDVDFITLFRRQATTNILSEQNYGEYLTFYNPDIVYIQLGICDCAPRYLKTNSICYRILRRLPDRITTIIWKIIKRRGRKLECTDVSKEQFEKNLLDYVSECTRHGVKKIIISKIGHPAKNMVMSNPQILESIVRFNKSIDKVKDSDIVKVEIIDPLSSGDASLYVYDGYHPNKNGHDLICFSLTEALKTCLI